MKKTLALTAVFCLTFSVNAYAKNVWELAESEVYGEKAGGMAGRGLLNVATSFIDIPVQMVAGAEKNKPEFVGAIGGLATGAVCTILRATSGVLDVATFWVPSFNGIPVSRSYENCLDFGKVQAAAPTPPPVTYTPPPAPQVVKPAAKPAPQAVQPPPPSKEDGPMKYIKK